MDWLDVDLEPDRPATSHTAWPVLASKFELRTQLRQHSVVMPGVGDRGSFTASTDVSDQDDDREPESASDGNNSEEEDEALSDDGSIHSSDLDFVEVDSDEGVSQEGAYEDPGYDSSVNLDEEGPQWSSEDDDAADLVLSTDVVDDLDDGKRSHASSLACADAARSPSIRGSNNGASEVRPASAWMCSVCNYPHLGTVQSAVQVACCGDRHTDR